MLSQMDFACQLVRRGSAFEWCDADRIGVRHFETRRDRHRLRDLIYDNYARLLRKTGPVLANPAWRESAHQPQPRVLLADLLSCTDDVPRR
jgi:hypothetical protein